MRIETERLILREYYESEADSLFQLANHWDIAKWLVALPHPYRREDATRWIAQVKAQHKNGRPLSFAFALKEGDILIGGGGLDGAYAGGKDDKVAVGYWLGLPYQGKGYGTEILKALVAYGFGHLGLGEIYASAKPDNGKSKNTLAKAGFQSIGTVALDEPSGGFDCADAYRIIQPEGK